MKAMLLMWVVSFLACGSSLAQWTIELVEGDERGVYNGIDLDADGYPHLCTQNEIESSLEYIYRNTDGWHLESAYIGLNAGKYGCICLDGNEYPYIAHNAEYQLKLTWKDIDGWHTETIDADGTYSACSIAIDSSGFPHIVYQFGSGSGLKYTWKDHIGWNYEFVDLTPGVGYKNSLKLDENDVPFVAYSGVGSGGNLMYAKKESGAWISDLIDSDDCTGEGISLRLNNQGYPCVSYIDRNGRIVKYASQNETGWNIETLGPIGFTSCESSLVIDSNGDPCVFYQESYDCVKMLSKTGDVWSTETIECSEKTGAFLVADIDQGGVTHLCYLDVKRTDLRYAVSNSVGWDIESVFAFNGVGLGISLAVDETNQPYISFQDSELDALKIAKKVGPVWEKEIVDNRNRTGFNSDIQIDSMGFPHISYTCSESAEERGVRYARFNGTDYLFDSLYYRTSDAKIIIDTLDLPHILHAGISLYVEYSFHDGTEWHTERISDSGDDYFCSAIDLDVFDNPHVCYSNNEYDYMKYTFYDGVQWHAETLTNAGIDPAHPSLVLDESGNPHIAFKHNDGKHRYMYLDTDGWICEIIENTTDSGVCSNLVLDENSWPHIVYGSSQGLKYARKNNTGWHHELFSSQAGSELALEIDSDGNLHLAFARNSYFMKKLGYGKYIRECRHTGDTDFNSEITSNDAQFIFLVVIGNIDPTFEEVCASDCNYDGVITSEDAQIVFYQILGLGQSCFEY